MTPIPKPTSSHQKGVKMKSTPTQPKKKIAMTKAVHDSISDTISSVIQGKGTHQKPTSPKKLVKNDKPKVIKKLCTKKAVVASSSSISTPKNDNANVTRAYNTKVDASNLKKQEKPVKAVSAAVKQLKPNVSLDVKSQIKPTNVVKRQNSPAKVVTAIADKDKTTTNVSKDCSKERTSNKSSVSEKKDKSAAAKNKMIAANKTTKMKKNTVLTDQKLIKQKIVTKPKKVVQNIKSGVNKKILISKPVALPKKIIKTITQKKKLPVKDAKDHTSNSPKLVTPTNCTITTPSSTSIDKVSTVSNSYLKENKIKNEPSDEPSSAKLVKVKEERDSDSEKKLPKVKPLSKVKSKPNSMMIKRLLSNQSVKNTKQSKKMKLYNMWNGPKRHRVASLNALAKVHCLYENESRSVLIDQIIDGVKKENTTRIKSEDEAPCSSTRQLRTAPGLRGVGKHWEMHESSSSSSRSSSSSEEDEYEFKETIEKPCLRKIRRIRDTYKVKEKIGDSNDETQTVAPTKPKRPRKPKKKPDSPIMDLKDLIVPKRMASLNASAILAASYSVEKRSSRPPNSDSEDSTDSGDSYFKEPIPEDEQLEQIVKMEQQQACEDERAKHIDVHAPPNSKKVAVILNQDTDVTITGMYVNSTRSTHHEGFCSIAGMQYRISATSHTQTAATAVTSETILQSASSGDHSTTNGDSASTSTGPLPTQQPNKSYTPLDALSSMQPPSGSTSGSSANLQQAPSTSGPQPQQQQQQQPLINPHHHNHHHSHNRQHISSPPSGPHTLHPLHQPQQQQYHHHHHHLGGPPPGHYHHPHQLVVAQYPPHQYYPHPGTIAHGGKSRYGPYHHHHHSSGDRGTYSNSSDNSAFSVPPGGLFPNSTSAGVASTVNSSSSVTANSGVGQPPPPTASQSSAGSGSESEIGSSSGYVHGYYQPAGPLISLSHGHSQPTPLVKTQPADPPSSISPLPLPPHKIQPPSSTGDSSDNEVIITSVTTINNKDSSASTNTTSRLSPSTALTQHPSSAQLPPSSHPSYRSSPYHPQYPPTTYTAYPPPSSYGSPYHSPYYSPYPPNHHELCYPAPGGGYVTAHKYPPPPSQSAAASAYRRYLASNAGGYYVTTASEIFGGQGPGPGSGPGGQQGGSSTPAATTIGSGASSNSSGSYQTASPHQQPPSGVSLLSSSSQQGPGQPPPPTIMETYTPPPPPPALLDSYPPPPPPSHYYPAYGPAAPPPPNCYTTHPHHSPSRGVPFLNAAYPPCPCPMQSCPKNVHTGPLTGDCKRSAALQIAKATTLPPVALALPLEPASATGPPSPARGSAGMPPPPSPAGATYQPLPPSSLESPSTSTHSTSTSTHSIQEMLPQLKNEQTSDSESTSNTETQTTQTSESTLVANNNEEVVDVKPEENRRKARVGKAMVRNSIQQQLNCVVNNGNGNTMLLMCKPNIQTVNQTTLISVVKREVESPEEVQTEIQQPVVRSEKSVINVELIVPEDLSNSKEQPNIMNGHVQNNQTNVEVFPVQAEPIVIQDVKTEKFREPSQVLEVAKSIGAPIEVLEPCQKTVAENVKVKNMKRKLSFNNNNNTEEKKVVEETPTPAKKSKSNSLSNNNNNNNIPNNGSYKDLIKKGCSTVKINNGRRKLISTNGGKLQSRIVPSKFPKKRTPIKRKASIPLKDETNSKRVKLNPKPLATNNSKESNHPTKEVKENPFIDTSLIENKEPPAKPKAKNGRRTSSNDIIKTNVDRTIESVVNQKTSSSVRTEKPPTRSRSNEKQKETLKEKEDKLTTNVGINSNIKRGATVKTSKTKVTELVPVLSVTNVSTLSADSFVKRSAIPCTSKSHCALPSPCKVVCVSDLCLPSTSKQSSVRKRKGVPLSAGSVACGTRSLKASASLAASVTAAAIPKTGRRSLQQPRWSNGWTWEGEPFQREVFLNSDDTVVVRKCYPSMRHREGDTIEPRDCVLLKAGPRKNDLPFVAKVAALWENPEDGEMMMSLLWYYRPEHTEQGRTCADQPDEVFASRHKDSNSVACIEDKCYVLTFNEYCRYRKTLRRLEEGLADTSPCIPLSEPYTRDCRQPPKQVPTSPEMIFFCRRVYDFRQKRIVKNPS